MKETKDLIVRMGTQLAADLIRVGDEPGYPCYRIQFMGTHLGDGERGQGGMNEEALRRFFIMKLTNYLNPTVL